MKRKSQEILLSLLILVMTGCGSLSNSRFFGFQQGKNKVIDREFESPEYYEESDQIIESENEVEPENPINPVSTTNNEKSTANINTPDQISFNAEENLDQAILPVDLALESEIIKTYEPIVNETAIDEEKEIPFNFNGMRIPYIILFVVLGLLLVVGVAILLVLYWY